jgi:ABC-2 type transport system ATP-binding protein
MIRMDGVTKRYGKVEALSGAALDVPEGAVMGLIGPNGAGKTTSMLIASTLLARDAGEVSVAGYDPAVNPTEVRRLLGYMPDFFGVHESVSCAEYLAFFAATQKVPAHRRPPLVDELLELVGLSDKHHDDVNTLSRGMKQRLSLARALIHDPALLVLDEPASGLDPRARVELRELIAELTRLGKTVLISSHILPELEGMCSHLAVIDRGRVLAHGEMDRIRGELSGMRRVRARVVEDDLERLERFLDDTDVVGDLVVERARARFTLEGGEAEQAALLAMVVAADIRVVEWVAEAAGLEEVFMRITGGGDEG